MLRGITVDNPHHNHVILTVGNTILEKKNSMPVTNLDISHSQFLQGEI